MADQYDLPLAHLASISLAELVRLFGAPVRFPAPFVGCDRGREGGFSLLELTFVIVLAGVLAVAAGPRLFSSADFSSRSFFDAAINSARYAQKVAVASGCNTRVQFTATGYALHQATTCGGLTFTRNVPDPADGAPFSDTAPAGVTVTASEVYFDAAGRPRNPATGALLGVSTDVVIGGSRTLRIEPESGYAHQL